MIEQLPTSSSKNPGLSNKDLLRVQKPAQYLGGELNSVIKSDSEVDVHFALAFPDTYEVGMSHLGLQILYQILNSDERTWAERSFMPMSDMHEILRSQKASLCSLESKRPLAEFDIIGFSLQYELCGTNIVSMLDLAQLPIYAQDRQNDHPLVIGGGPYSYHPEALAPFFDAFFLGDAEEAILELVNVYRKLKADSELGRKEILLELGKIEGVYIPAHFIPIHSEAGTLLQIKAGSGSKQNVTRRLLPTMNGAPYVQKPIVPNIQTVHNRLSIEVMRGCVRGCRFCQAGYLYRPQRERSPEEILQMIETALPSSGFEELSLLSLSTADYCSIVPLLKSVMDRFGEGDKLAVSFPSTRVDALTPEVLEQVQRVRRTGFTIAPEGGTQRLRDVINKGVSDDQIIETCTNVFRMGWTGIKLYFILGLPTETDQDLEGIIELATRLKKIPEAKGKDITVSVSTLVPKPHTPFQWAAQITPEETIRRQRILADGLRRVGVNFRYHNAFSTFLEGVFCRGGRELAEVIVRAYQLGARLDAWQEHLKEEIWMQAFLDCNIDPYFYLREREVTETLPWDHLDCGISKTYFLKEYQRALRDRTTADCLTQSCSICGACDYDIRKNILWPRAETEVQLQQKSPSLKASKQNFPNIAVSRTRLCYQKSGAYAFIGHLELARVFHRATRRAELPVTFTQGFHPMPRIVFGPPLQLGIASREEFADLFLNVTMDTNEIRKRINDVLPEGLMIKEAISLPLKGLPIQQQVRLMGFRTTWLSKPLGLIGKLLEKNFTSGYNNLSSDLELALSEVIVTREKGKSKQRSKHINQKKLLLADYISKVNLSGTPELDSPFGFFEFSLRFDPQSASIRPLEVVKALSELDIGDYKIEKISTVFKSSGENIFIDHPALPLEANQINQFREPLQNNNTEY